MTTFGATEETEKVTPARTTRAGRRPRTSADGTAPSLTKEQVLAHAVALAQTESVEDITIARLSRDLGVTTSLIHYFVGSRDELLSAIFNLALKNRAEHYPPLTGDWRLDLEAHLRQTHQFQLQWRGITTYVATHNRHRLFQQVAEGEVDYGLVFFDRIGRILRSSGLSAERAAMAYHLLMLFLTSVASAHINRQEPCQHQSYLLEHVALFAPPSYEGAHFLMPAFARVSTAASFDEGLRLLLDGIVGWRDKQTPSTGQGVELR